MLIECLQKRRLANGKPGSSIPIANEVYVFAPNDDGKHVCQVNDKEHIELFIRAGYVAVEGRSNGIEKGIVNKVHREQAKEIEDAEAIAAAEREEALKSFPNLMELKPDTMANLKLQNYAKIALQIKNPISKNEIQDWAINHDIDVSKRLSAKNMLVAVITELQEQERQKQSTVEDE